MGLGFFRGRWPQSWFVVVNFLCLLRFFKVEASVTLLNATQQTVASTNTNYDHQVTLLNNANDPLDDVLIFRWDDPTDGILTASLLLLALPLLLFQRLLLEDRIMFIWTSFPFAAFSMSFPIDAITLANGFCYY